MMKQRPTSPIFSSARICIGGEWSSGRGEYLEQIEPSTGEVLGRFPCASPADAEAAFAAAKAAAPAWRKMPVDKRRDILMRIAAQLETVGEEFGIIAARETGHIYNPLGAANAVNRLVYYAGWIDKIEGSVVPMPGTDAFNYTVYEPYGIVLALTTWNAPLATMISKLAPALAAGNCVIVKPSELGTFASLRLAEIMYEAGLPSGVLSVLPGGPKLGASLVTNPHVGKISFTGGVTTARAIAASAAQNMVPLTMELGGKSANIVFKDADLDRAAIMASEMGCMRSAGQGCLYPTRLLIEDAVYDQVLERVLARAGAAKVGDPFAPGVDVGPLISEAACERVMGHIDAAKASGSGRLLLGGNRAGGDLAKGFYVHPTVFGDVDNSGALAQKEIFGPVLSVMRFKDEEEAISMANDTEFGLAAYVHTKDLGRSLRVASAMDAGYVGVNGFPPLPVTLPFGGYKLSGYGKESGRAGINEYLREKSVHVVA
jgi:aldehyde dehydrogenase (NAD+)